MLQASDVAKQLPAGKMREAVTNSIEREGDNHFKKKRQLGIWLWNKMENEVIKIENTMGNE